MRSRLIGVALRSAFVFTGRLLKVTATMDDDQVLNGEGVGQAIMARE
jgi:hypothetical protein